MQPTHSILAWLRSLLARRTPVPPAALPPPLPPPPPPPDFDREFDFEASDGEPDETQVPTVPDSARAKAIVPGPPVPPSSFPPPRRRGRP